MSFLAPLGFRVTDPDTDRVLRNQDERIREVVAVPAVSGKVFKGVKLESGVDYRLTHLLRRPAIMFVSPVRGALSTGRIEDVTATNERNNILTIKALGWGADIYVDVWVF